MNAENTEMILWREIHAGNLALRQEIEQILRLRLQMREENIRAALDYLNKGQYEMARITLETFAT